MWRGDITRTNPSRLLVRLTSILNYYVMNSDFRVYICLYNNAYPENNFQGGPSLDEPTFTDIEPREQQVTVVMDTSGNTSTPSNPVKSYQV